MNDYEDLASLRLFLAEHPVARAYCLHAGTRRWNEGGIEVLPAREALVGMAELLRPLRGRAGE